MSQALVPAELAEPFGSSLLPARLMQSGAVRRRIAPKRANHVDQPPERVRTYFFGACRLFLRTALMTQLWPHRLRNAFRRSKSSYNREGGLRASEMNRGILRPDSAASPTAQWDRNLSPAEVSSETGISAVVAGDFREILAKVADFKSLEIGGLGANIPRIAGISRKNCPQSQVE
jgi:hypothetical protein